MVQASELRVGNILSVDGNLWHVESIIGGKNPELYFVENDDYDHYLNAEPIPLTPELLKAIEFVNTPTLGLVWHNGQKRFARIVNGASIPHKTLYLHQLQNLFFALTGQELTVNIPQPQSA